jgi:DegV family protein with EDD domain
MPIKIITDSTSDLPIDLADSLGVTIVPATIIFGQEQFKDRVELTPTQFYERLVSSPVHPTTSAPDIDQFVEAYQSVGSDADGIVSIHVSAKLSATYNAAFQASRQVGLRCPIEVIDSEQASFGLGLAVIAAAKSAAGGADFETVKK